MKIQRFIPLIALFFFWACTENQTQGQKITPDAFQKKLTEEKDAYLLDVRTPQEYRDGHLANFINMDYYEAGFSNELEKLNTDNPVFVYCRSGKRSGETVKMLQKMGFKEIYDLKGGITAWIEDNKKVVK